MKGERNKKEKCRWCGKSNGVIKFYIIADDMENPKPYHAVCYKQFSLYVWEVMMMNYD